MFSGRAAAWTVAFAFRTFHRADERGFLQKAITAHAASEQRSFDGFFKSCQCAAVKGLALEGEIGWLPTATGSEDGHGGAPTDVSGVKYQGSGRALVKLYVTLEINSTSL